MTKNFDIISKTNNGANPQRATLDYIAKRVGVTKMTVSRALRGVGRISQSTREKVRQAASEMGYLNHNHGVLMTPSHRGTTDLRLSVLMVKSNSPSAQPESEFYQELLAGLNDRLALSEGRVTEIDSLELDPILTAWDNQRAHGLVLRCQLPPAIVEKLRRRGPVVYAIPNDVYAGVDALYCTEMRTAALVNDYLARRGHHNLAWFGFFDAYTGSEFTASNGIDPHIASINGPRYAAWNYIAQYNTHPNPQTVVILERDWRKDSLSDVVRRGLAVLLTTRPQPSAVVVPSDCVGIELVKQAREVGLRVPEDLSVIAYGGTSEARKANPPLTCVKLPLYTIGRTIPELIERRLADPNATPVTIQFEAVVEKGKSVAKLNN